MARIVRMLWTDQPDTGDFVTWRGYFHRQPKPAKIGVGDSAAGAANHLRSETVSVDDPGPFTELTVWRYPAVINAASDRLS